jgi:hypothetical protein
MEVRKALNISQPVDGLWKDSYTAAPASRADRLDRRLGELHVVAMDDSDGGQRDARTLQPFR